MFVGFFLGCWDKLRASGREPELLFVKDKWKHQRGKRETFAHGKRPLPKPPPPSPFCLQDIQLKKHSPPHFILHTGIPTHHPLLTERLLRAFF